MKYPVKLQTTLTLACIDLHNARSKADVESVLDSLEEFDQLNHPVPEWMLAWIVATLQHPLLTAQEHLKLPKPPSPFAGMGPKHHQPDREKIEQKRLQDAIHEAGCDDPVPKKMAAIMIADRLLSNASGSSDEYGGGLGYEWHCKATDSGALSDSRNYALMVEILQRETDFWQDGVKGKSAQRLNLNRPAAIPGAPG